jgi:hypothetical protein
MRARLALATALAVVVALAVSPAATAEPQLACAGASVRLPPFLPAGTGGSTSAAAADSYS